jgi:hypothetical protein
MGFLSIGFANRVVDRDFIPGIDLFALLSNMQIPEWGGASIGYGYDGLAFLDEITKFLLIITKHFNDRPI